MKLNRFFARTIAALGITIMLVLTSAPLFAGPVQAAACDSTYSITSGINCATPSGVSQSGLFDKGDLFKTISDTLIIVIGAISVLMVIIGGLRYVLSTGSPQATAGAKDTILYAVIGLVIAILAFAIVQFVVTRFGG